MHYRNKFRPVFRIHSADHSEGLAARPAAGVEGNCFCVPGVVGTPQTRMLLDCFVAQSKQSCERWIWSISGFLVTLGLTGQFAANREYVRFHLIDRRIAFSMAQVCGTPVITRISMKGIYIYILDYSKFSWFGRGRPEVRPRTFP